MYLALKTDSATTQIIFLDTHSNIIAQIDWESGRSLADQLLGRIADELQNQKFSWSDVTGVILFRGPGSFTSLRIGATVANTIAYARTIPIVGALGEQWVSDGAQRLQKGENDNQVLPFYGAEPNITTPKR